MKNQCNIERKKLMNLFYSFAVPMAGNWDINSFLTHAKQTLGTWGAAFVALLGVIMVIAAAYMIGKGLISHGKSQTNWAVAIILLLVGGAFSAGGWTLLNSIAQGGTKTIQDLGNGSSAPSVVVVDSPHLDA